MSPELFHGIHPSGRDYEYLVPSETDPHAAYRVRTDKLPWTCDCLGYRRWKDCKHIQWMIEYLKAYVNECEAKYELLDEEEPPVAKRVGVLWLKTSKDGKTKYWSGVVNLGILGDIQISILRNTFKKEENQPDYNILLVEPKPEQTPANGKADYDDSDIPF